MEDYQRCYGYVYDACIRKIYGFKQSVYHAYLAGLSGDEDCSLAHKIRECLNNYEGAIINKLIAPKDLKDEEYENAINELFDSVIDSRTGFINAIEKMFTA